jgi:hypothetical protein
MLNEMRDSGADVLLVNLAVEHSARMVELPRFPAPPRHAVVYQATPLPRLVACNIKLGTTAGWSTPHQDASSH